MKYVESFESSIHEWKFKEDEGSEGEEFDGEGWNLKFWRDHEGREQRRNEEQIRRQSLETGRTDAFTGKPFETKSEIFRGRSRQRDKRSYSQSSDSRSTSRSPPRLEEQELSYSRSPPRRRRPQSRTPSPSSSPTKRWSPPPRDRPSQHHNVSIPNHQVPSTNPPHASGLQPQYSYGTASHHYPHASSSQQHPYADYTSNSGYYPFEVPPHGTSSTPWDQQAQYRPPPPPHWTQSSMGSPQNYSRNTSSGEYGKGENDMQNRSWK